MFAGQEHDAESQTDYVRARYYQGQTGRFTSVDPAHVNGDPFDSQSWNAYAFGRNNPLKFSDPTGTDYLISAYGGTPFWFDQGVGDFRSLKRYLTAQGFQTLGDDESGVILNEAGEVVADYSYTSRSARMFGDAGQMSSAWLKAGITEMGKNALFSAGLGALRWGLEAGAAYLEAAEIANAARVGAATEHAAGRLLLRGISPGDVNTAIKTAKIAGQVTTQAGKYSTLQKVYIGTNGITVIVEQAGRNAGKVITAFPTGLP
jgi:RHS repeat-associated protein